MPIKEIKGFCTRDDFTNNDQNVVNTLYEISEYSLSFAKHKQTFYNTVDSVYSLHVFKLLNATTLLQNEADSIFKVMIAFQDFVTGALLLSKQQTLIAFLSSYNLANPTEPISELDYNVLITSQSVTTADYITFNINTLLKCSIWTADITFKNLYPDYDITIVAPFDNFNIIVNNPTDFIAALDAFSLLEFNERVQLNKTSIPNTYTKILNIPYNVPSTTVVRNTYFAFNIYGQQGNFDYILKLELFNYLKNVILLTDPEIQEIFPTILNINEFFFVPRWDKVAIPSQVGTSSIHSQLANTYEEPFDIDKFVKVVTDVAFLKANTYSLPIDHNNLMIHIVNGFFSEVGVKDFKLQYPDIITVFSSHPDFSRMSTVTQNFLILLENLLVIADVDNSTEMFNRMIASTDFEFNIITRETIDYLTIFNGEHQLYMLPRYEFIRLN